MDPLSAMIGAGASLIGGFFNRSSTQAINSANLQQQMFMATGGYLPGLVSNAEKAGINPLAVLGQHAPTGGTAVPIGDGGISDAGKFLSQIKDPHTEKMQDLQEKAAKYDVLTKTQQYTQLEIDNAIRQKTLADLQSGKTISGPEPSITRQVGETLRDQSRGVIDQTLDQFRSLGRDWRGWTGAGDAPAVPGYGNLGSYLDWITKGFPSN